MRYDLTRAEILLRDLERIPQGRWPGVRLVASPNGPPAVRGTCTRFGLLRMGVRLAQAALDREGWVVIDETGDVQPGGGSGMIEILFADEHPPVPEPPPTAPWWAAVFSCTAIWVMLALAGIGFVTALRWVGEVLRG